MLQIQRQARESAADLNWYQHPERHCDRPELHSQGAINWLNSKVGKPNGPSGRVVGSDGPMVPVGSQQDPHQSNCHVTLIFDNGRREAGTMHFDDNPFYQQSLNVSWTSDAQAATNAAVNQSPFALPSKQPGVCEERQRQYEVCLRNMAASVAPAWKLFNSQSEYMRAHSDPPPTPEGMCRVFGESAYWCSRGGP